MKTYNLKLNELHILVDEISENFKSGIVILKGDLAAGKTTLVKEIAKKLGIEDMVTSPTFSLQHCYGDNFFHYDIYNHGLEHFVALGLLEELEKDGLHFIEWGDDELLKILILADMETLVIEIEKISDEVRKYKVDYAHA